MALAAYFSKNLLAISQVLQKGSVEEFQKILNTTIIGIAFDDELTKPEGQAALHLTVRLVSRLYPALNFIDLSSKKTEEKKKLIALSKSINSAIEITEDTPSIVIAITGKKIPLKITPGPIFYIGSNGWTVKFSTESPVRSGESTIPFAAGISACIGTSNIFRYIFREFLPDVAYDDNFSLSLLTMQAEKSDLHANMDTIDVGDFLLVGFGAIGNGAIWALANAPFLKGNCTIVEPEDIEITNLQRYVLAEEKHIKKPKIDIAVEHIKDASLQLSLIQSDWATYLQDKAKWMNACVLVAVDNSKDRIGIQSSLPKEIINSYTENNLIGISRHYNFIDEACVVCTYMPTAEKKSYASEVCQNLGLLPQLENQIGGYLYSNQVVDEQLIQLVAAANNITPTELEKFRGIPAREFYSKFVCGGILMELRKNGNKTGAVEAPLAFQSALAGILLVTELVIIRAGLRKNNLPTKTHIYPLYPIKSESNPYTHTFPKDITGRCICSDNDFIHAYKKKWLLDNPSKREPKLLKQKIPLRPGSDGG